MDYRRSCSTSVMQIGNSPATQYTIPIRWYFAPKGAKTFRGVNAFTAQIWDRGKPFDQFVVGEQNPTGEKWYNGRNVWGYLGQCFIGSLHDYEFGLSAADIANPRPAIPGCCLKMRAPLGVRFGIGKVEELERAELGVAFGVHAHGPEPAELGVAFGMDTDNTFAAELGVALGMDTLNIFNPELGVAFGLAAHGPGVAELGVAFGMTADLHSPAELGVAFGMTAIGFYGTAFGVAFGMNAVQQFNAEIGVAFGMGITSFGPYLAELGVAFGMDTANVYRAELGVAFGMTTTQIVPVPAELGVAFGMDTDSVYSPELGVAFGMDTDFTGPFAAELGVAFGWSTIYVIPPVVCTPAVWPRILTVDAVDTGSCSGATGIYIFNWNDFVPLTGTGGFVGLSDLDPNVQGVIYCDPGTSTWFMLIHDFSNSYSEAHPLNFAGFFPDIAANVPHDFGPGYSFCTGTFNIFGINGSLV